MLALGSFIPIASPYTVLFVLTLFPYALLVTLKHSCIDTHTFHPSPSRTVICR